MRYSEQVEPTMERLDGGDVFVSYNRRDSGSTERLASALRERGVSVFFDRWSLLPGGTWTADLENALNASRAVIVIIGPHGLSDWQRAESDLALDRQRRGESVTVIPVLIPGADPPLGFLRLHTWVDLRAGVDDDVLLDQLVAITRGGRAATPPAICPYRGLRPFREEDAAFFFGRDEFVERVRTAVHASRMVAVVGASGSGKSSAVRAGLFPALRSDPRHEWLILTMRPGTRPFHALAASMSEARVAGPDTEYLVETRSLGDALAAGSLSVADAVDGLIGVQPDRTRTLLVIDQWEEIYTLVVDQTVRADFIRLVLSASEHGVHVLFTVRGDFFDDVLEHRGLADALHGAVVSLGPMTSEELRACIEKPAERVGLRFEAGLANTVLIAAERGVGTLPLLEFVLTRLWENREGNLLSHAAYAAMGGMDGAIAQRAEDEHARLDARARDRLREVMLQLVRVSASGGDTRRRATREEIGEAAWPIALGMADARLLVTARDETTGSDTVEIAHEALIHHWGRLRGWLDEDREFLLWRARFGSVLDQYVVGGRAALLRGVLLDEARRWKAAKPDRINNRERSFIDHSVHQARRLVLLRFAYIGALVLVLGAGSFAAVRAMREHTTATNLREARILAAAAAAPDPLTAALLVAELSPRREPPAGTRLAREIASRPVPVAVLARGSRRLLAAALAPDGSSVLTGYDDGVVMVWPADGRGDGELRQTMQGAIHQLAFNADGAFGLAASSGGDFRVWHAGGSDAAPWTSGAHPGRVLAAAFGPGTMLVTAADDDTVRVWSLTTNELVRSLNTGGGVASEVVVSGSGNLIGTAGDSTAVVWRPNTRADDVIRLRGHSAPIVTIAFNPGETHAVTSSHDGTVRVWDLLTGAGQIVHTAAHGGTRSASFIDDERIVAAAHDGSVVLIDTAAGTVVDVAMHRGGAWVVRTAGDGTVVSAGADSTARVSIAGELPLTLAGHTDVVFDVAWSTRADRVITASVDGSVRVWDTPGRSEPVVLRTPSPARAAALDLHGNIVIGTDDGTAWLWTAAAGEARPLRGHTDGVRTVTFDRTGSTLLTGSWDGTARLWDVGTGEPVTTLHGSGGSVTAAMIDAAGGRIITAYDAPDARLWSGPDFHTSVPLRGHTDLVHDAAFDPPGSTIATGSADHTARLWRAADATAIGVLRHHGAVTAVTFAHDQPRIVTASEDSTAVIWDARTGEAESLLRGHEDAVFKARFSPDDSRVVTASADGTARVWAPGLDPIVLRGHRRDVLGARFSRDGSRVVTVSTDSTARVFPISPPAEATVLSGHAGAVRDAFFTADDNRVVTVSEDGSARVWRASWGTLHEYLAAASTACLDVTVRVQVLDESERRAQERHARCERNHGRTVQEPSGSHD